MLHVHRSDRADGLIEALRALLAQPPDDPFAPEVVAVPTRGMERWLTQRLSTALGATPGRTDGVCANIEFPFPHRLTTAAVAAASGIEPDEDPWLPERLVWPLLDVVDEALDEPFLKTLARHLETTSARRFAAVRHLADLFDRYALHRPELVRGWAQGRDDHWQAELWRRLAATIDVPDPAARVTAACARLSTEPDAVDLPPRLSLFGLTRLPRGHLDVLRTLAEHRDVHLFLLHPSPKLWERIAALRPQVTTRLQDPTTYLPANRLLASWGQDARELQLVLGPGATTHEHPVEHTHDTLLARLQRDVREDHAPPGAPLAGEPDERRPLDEDDRSLQIHACHGRARQVEVVRDAILHLLAEDATLEPRDVIVMCPDIETFAPLIQATFGAGELEEEDTLPGPPDLRVRLADRSLRQTNPVLGAVARLLELAEERLTASQVLDLADREPVRRRFRLDDDALARLEDWVADSGIRWGLDKEHREPFKLDQLDEGTWRRGLDRLLLGVTMTEDEQRLYAGVLPLDDVESGAIDLAGRLAELLDRLREAVDALAGPMPIADWATAIARAADALTATAPFDTWQRSELQRILDDVVTEAAGRPTELELAEIRALLAERLQGRPTRANFRTGHLTICTLVPMRSVPHRVVCLLGLDDGTFPRKTVRDGDDLMLREPRVGERDSRTEDRQMLLDALLAARDRLIITYTGNDERTNIPRPPAVPVGELLDMVDRTVRAPRERIVVRHPLQPFDRRNFTAGALVPGKPWSFDRVTLDGARALTGSRAPKPPFLAGPLPEERASVLELEELVRFAAHPVQAFLRGRLGLSVRDYTDEIEDALPVELDGLARYAVGQRMLEALLAGAGVDVAVDAEVARGKLPPRRLADPVIARVRPVVEEIAVRAGIAPTVSLDVRVVLDDGRPLTGTVAGVAGDVLRSINFSRVSARHRLQAWVRLLALTAAYPDRRFEALTAGRGEEGVALFRIRVVGAERARAELAALAELYDAGMREPLPIACRTSAAFAASGEDAARAAWTSAWNFPREDADPEHQLVYGGVVPFDTLLEDPRFAGYARALWAGLLEHER